MLPKDTIRRSNTRDSEHISLLEKHSVPRVPTVVQWIKNLTAAAQVTAEARVQSLAQELPYALGAAFKKKKFLSMAEGVITLDHLLSVGAVGRKVRFNIIDGIPELGRS